MQISLRTSGRRNVNIVWINLKQFGTKCDQQETTRAAQQAIFQQCVEDELEALQRGLEEDVQERQTRDEEIVAALNR
jgi:hypothetical protein